MVSIPHAEFVEQLEPHLSVLKAYCRRLAGNGPDGEDLYQTTLEKAYRAYGGMKPGMSRAYLFRIAKNAWIDRYRTKTVREVPLLDEYAAQGTGDDGEVREAFEVMAERLSVRQSVLLLMIEVFGFTAKETAVRLGSTEGAVKDALKRARLRLARYAPERDTGARPKKPARTGSSDGTPREWMELFIRAFRSGNVRQILTSYTELRRRGVDVAQVYAEEEGILYFDFLDPNGHLMRIYSPKVLG